MSLTKDHGPRILLDHFEALKHVIWDHSKVIADHVPDPALCGVVYMKNLGSLLVHSKVPLSHSLFL